MKNIFTLDLNKDELMIIINSLNEILSGPDAIIEEEEFHPRIGVDRVVAEELIRKLSKIYNLEN